jgi:nicotinate dehydrogenase subunit B
MLGSESDTNVAGIYEVAVNRRTGVVHVQRVTIVQDCGLIVNPAAVRNQIEGGVIQSISRALKEEVTFDHSRVTTLDWSSYPIITFNEIPDEIDIVLMDHPDLPPMRVGEPASESVWPGVANAVFDAIGVRIRQLPLTPDRVLNALAEKA